MQRSPVQSHEGSQSRPVAKLAGRYRLLKFMEFRGAAGRRIGVPVMVVFVTLSTYSLLKVFPRAFPPRHTVVKVDMQTDAGNIVEVYLNGSSEPLRQKIQAKKRTFYTFPVDGDVKILRLDPTDVAAAQVNLYSIAVEDAQQVIRRIEPKDLTLWVPYNLASPKVVNGAFHFQAANNNPALASMLNLRLQYSASDAFASYVARAPTAEFLPALIALSFMLALSAAVFSPCRLFHLPLACAILWMLPLVILTMLGRYHRLTPADIAVGGATFFGRSIRANQVAMLLATVLAGLLAAAAWWVFRRISLAPLFKAWAARGSERASSVPGSMRLPVAVFIVCVLGLIYFPNLRETANAFQQRLFPPGWDSNNLTYWSYLVHKGFVPLRDFWYPYSGFYVFDLPLPAGPILRWLYMWMLLTIFFFSFYRLSGSRLTAAVPATALMVIGDRGALLGDFYRYLLAVDVVLSYLAIEHTRPDWVRGAIWFWLSCALALFFEPAQIVYAGAAIAAKITLDFWQCRPRQWAVWRRRLLLEFSVPFGSGLLVLGWLGMHGQLPQFLKLHLRLTDLAIYSAIPTNLGEGLKDRLSLNFIALAAPPLLLAIGLFERLRNGKPSGHADALIGLGIVGYLLCQKHLVREMAGEMLPVFLAALLAYILLWQGRRSYLEYVSVAIIAGAFLLLTIQTGATQVALSDLKSSPRKLADSLQLLGRQRPLLDEANRAAYAPERFALFPNELSANTWIRQLREGEAAQVFALSDDTILYILRGQPPVYLANLYNASPVYEQKALVSWLEARKPQYVTLDPAMTDFDGIPNAVRCPLVFERVINGWVPERVGEKIEILRRRLPNESVPLAYWREKLGSTLYLGHLPRVSSFSRFQPCKSQSADGCVDFLHIHLASKRSGPLLLPVEAGGLAFSLQFEAVGSVDDYYVLLDRVWFWKVAKDHGGAVHIPKQKTGDGLEVEMVSRQDLHDVLY